LLVIYYNAKHRSLYHPEEKPSFMGYLVVSILLFLVFCGGGTIFALLGTTLIAIGLCGSVMNMVDWYGNDEAWNAKEDNKLQTMNVQP